MNVLKNEIAIQIKQLRERGESYKDIAIILGKNKDAIRKYCRKNNMGDGFNGKLNTKIKMNINEIEKRFEQKFPGFLYVSGYTNCESMIKIRCKVCGDVFERCASILRKEKRLECHNCTNIKQKDAKETKRKEIELKRIYREKEKIELKKIKEQKHIKSYTKICTECGKSFISKAINQKCCSPECRKKRANRIKEVNRRNKLKENGKINWDISLDKLIKRDKNVCHICGDKCNNKDYIIDKDGNFIVGKDYPSIDHVLPVSKGGTHTWNNIKLAHHYCNSMKRDEDIYEKENGQLIFSI